MLPRQTMLTASDLRARFDEPSGFTVGLEEEIMVLDRGTLDLAPVGFAVARAVPGGLVKPEFIASQLEIAAPPMESVADAVAHLARVRRELAETASARGLCLAAAGAHPFAAVEGGLTPGARYEALASEYAFSARRQLCCALQVHVAVRPADRALAVHNALRSHLPEIAALAANAPYYGGADTGLASVRPQLTRLLPRQGIPPAIESFEEHAEALRWTGDPAIWWWELRPHPSFGTLEMRVPDAQSTVADATAVALFAHALVCWLAARHAGGETLPVAETWRIEENRWSALRHGPAGTMRDLETGESEATAELLSRRVAELEAACGLDLAPTRALLAAGGPAARLRAASGGDVRLATRHLTECFLEGIDG